MPIRSLYPLAILFGLMLAAAPAQSAELASAWAEAPMARAQLIAEPAPAGLDRVRAGIRIDLQPGWKVYWRVPGESGIPPTFDWTGSVNAEVETVYWPAPDIFEIEGETIFGYQGDVVLPLSVRMPDPGAPAELQLTLDYGVCADMCVPLHQTLTLALVPAQAGAPATPGLIDRFMQRVPSDLTAQAIAQGLTATVNAQTHTLDLPFPAGLIGQSARVIIEGPTSFYFDNPFSVGTGTSSLSIPLNGGKSERLRGQTLNLTILMGDKAAQFTLPVAGRTAP